MFFWKYDLLLTISTERIKYLELLKILFVQNVSDIDLYKQTNKLYS